MSTKRAPPPSIPMIETIANPQSAPHVFSPEEPRLLSFLVERRAEGTPIEPPFLVWVAEPIKRDRYYTMPCKCQCVYRVSDESVREWWRANNWPGSPALTISCVCACNGRLIE